MNEQQTLQITLRFKVKHKPEHDPVHLHHVARYYLASKGVILGEDNVIEI